jgi:phospholipase C
MKRALGLAILATLAATASTVRADGNLQNVNHIIIVMQENHSFDNYFGVLAFAAGTPYHSAKGSGRRRACPATDHTCVDGLSCKVNPFGPLICKNRNPSASFPFVIHTYHESRYCTGPDLDHSWDGSHGRATSASRTT